MASYTNSIHALRELLVPSNLSHSSSCSITKISQNISHLSNGVEYCLIEITCNDGIQYGIQACGDEAVELHKEALKYCRQQQPLQREKQQEELEGEKQKEERQRVVTPFV
jgi:hypothetical protein